MKLWYKWVKLGEILLIWGDFMQDRLKFNDYVPPTVTEDGYVPSFATTSTANSGRTMRGNMINTPLFTVQAFQLKWANLKASEASRILKEILGKDSFNFHYYSVYHDTWKTEKFYVANVNSIQIKSLVTDNERVQELSFQITGTEPI